MAEIIEKLSFFQRSFGGPGEMFWQMEVALFASVIIFASIMSVKDDWNRPAVKVCVFLTFATLLLTARLPLLTQGYFHPDEAEWLTYANTLKSDPTFWITDAFASTRTLTVVPLALFSLSGFELDFMLGKLANICGWVIISLLTFLILNRIINKYSFILLSPLLLSILHWNLYSNVTYNSEIPGIILLLIIVNFVQTWMNDDGDISTSQLFFCGLIASSLPLIKLNFALFSFFTYFLLIIYSKNRLQAFKAMILSWVTIWVPFITLLAVTNEMEAFYAWVIGHFGYAAYGFNGEQSMQSQVEFFEAMRITLRHVYSPLDLKPILWSFSALMFGGIVLLKIKKQLLKICSGNTVLLVITFLVASFLTAFIPKTKLPNHVILYFFFLYLLTVLVYACLLKHSKSRYLSHLLLFAVTITGGVSFMYSIKNGNYAFRNTVYPHKELIDEIQSITSTNDTIVTWGVGQDLYVHSERIQGSRYLYLWEVLSGLPGKEIQIKNFLEDLELRKPKLFIDCCHENNVYWMNKKLFAFENFPKIRDKISTDYEFHKNINGYRIFKSKMSL